MFQKEVADRIMGQTNDKNYGRLSIISNWKFNIKREFDIDPSSFYPKPKVNSMVIHFKPKKNCLFIKDLNNLEKVTNILFSNKRKMINKNIKKIFNSKEIGKLKKVKLSSRPSEIDPNIYYKMAMIYENQK